VKVSVDVDKCIGAGQCVFNAPEVFDQDDDSGIAVVLHESPAPELHPAARLAMQACPAWAIRIDD
jgi:ferredoxin